MRVPRSLDALVRIRLRAWPQSPPGLPRATADAAWLRGRPGDETGVCHPYLKVPGSQQLRTLPDGLWLRFAGDATEPFVDIFAIEACGTLPNFLDKRARFAPSTHSLLAVCPVPWLLAPVGASDATPRWRTIPFAKTEPVLPLVVPVRDVRVLYGLKPEHYAGFVRSQAPQAHEFFAPMDTLTAKDSDRDPALQALVSRANLAANFL
jgi:hypothetical protein